MRRLSHLFDRLASSVDAKPAIWTILACWIFFAVTGFRAAHQPYWYDELITVKITALQRFADIWAALRMGLDLNPPFQYLAIRISQSLFGTAPMATRLPMTLGFLVMSLCIFLYLRRRVPVTLAFAGMMLPWLTDAYTFAIEARPYGILLGCSGVVLLCWSSASSPRRRPLHVAGLAAALAIALATHCYAVLLAIPLAAGEAFRLKRTRRPDWILWSSMAISALPVLLYPVLMRSNGAPVSSSWLYRPDLWTIPGAYVDLLGPFLLPLLPAVLLVLLTLEPPAAGAVESAFQSVPRHEMAALAGFAAIPAGAVLLAATTTGSFAIRYGTPGVIGVACLAAVMVDRSSLHPARHGAVLAAVFLGFFTGTFGHQLGVALRGQNVQAASPAPQPPAMLRVAGYPPVPAAVSEGLPVVIASGLQFMEIDHNSDDALLARTYYLTDIDAAVRHTGAAWFDFTYPAMKRQLHLRANVEPADRFLARSGRFLMYSSGAVVEWLPREMLARGWHIRLLARDQQIRLPGREGFREVAEVTPPGSW